MESFYEYGSRAGVWRLIRLLDEHAISYSLFACAEALARNKELVGALDKRRERIEVVSHALRWVDRSRWTAEEERENVGKAIESELLAEKCFTSSRELTHLPALL